MANNISILDSASAAQVVKTTDTASVHTPHHNVDTCTTVTTCSTVTGVTTVSTLTNLAQFGGQAITMGTGVRAAGTLRVTVATDDSVPVTNAALAVTGNGTAATAQRVTLASDTTGTMTVTLAAETTKVIGALGAGTNAIGKLTANSGVIIGAIEHSTSTTGGESSLSALSTAAVYTAEVKGSAGQIYGVEIFNKGAAAVYARLYNQTGAPGSGDAANIIWRGIVPGSATGAGFVKGWPNGKICGTGIGIRVSGAIADNDTTVLAANEVTVNVGYK